MSTLISTELTWMVLEFATKKDGTVDQYIAHRGLQDLLWFLRNGFDHVEPTVELGACTAHSADNKFVDCAYEARAVLVSKNLHLLDLDGRIPLPDGSFLRMIAPEAFQAAYLEEQIHGRL